MVNLPRRDAAERCDRSVAQGQNGLVAQAGDVIIGDKYWRGMTMEMIRIEDTLVVKTSKTGKPVVHALASCQLVVECLEKIGKSATDGPVARQTSV